MKEKFYAFLLAIIIAVAAYIMVSAASAHYERDNTALLQWYYQH